MFLIFSLSWNFLPTAISSSMSIATNTTLPLSSGSPASLSQVGSSFAHGLHQSAPTVTTTHLPFHVFSLTGLPLASVATSSSARRSPTLRTSARAVPAAAMRTTTTAAIAGAMIRAMNRPCMVVGRIGGLSIHRDLFVDPHLDVPGVHRPFVLAVVEEQGGRRVHTGVFSLLQV